MCLSQLTEAQIHGYLDAGSIHIQANKIRLKIMLIMINELLDRMKGLHENNNNITKCI